MISKRVGRRGVLALIRHLSIIVLRRQGENNFDALHEAGGKLGSVLKMLIG